MADAARNEHVVREMADYLRETIHEMDQSIASTRSALSEMQRQRRELGLRLAVIDAATDTDVNAAIADYEQRIVENRPYEDAEDATDLLTEAHRRFHG